MRRPDTVANAMVRANIHNLVVITALVTLGFYLLRMLRRTGAARVPVLGQVLQMVPAA
jgi:hypothetical protein